MIYRGLADFTLILHFCFVLFAVFGGILVIRRRFIAWFHPPAVFWGFLVEFFHLPCPLTFFENRLRQLGGEAGYSGGFIEYFIELILYTPITPQFQMFLGCLLLGFNLFVYSFIFWRLRRYD
jgi:hypothetical protein